MYCQKCGADNLENAAICQQCGGVFVYSQPTRTSGMAITSMILGISGFPMFGVFCVTLTLGLIFGIMALVMWILSLVFGTLALIKWIVGLILGILSAGRVGKSGGQIKGRGFAITGITTSASGLTLLLVAAGVLLFLNSTTTLSMHRKLKMQTTGMMPARIGQKPSVEGQVYILNDKTKPATDCVAALFTPDQFDANDLAISMNMTCGREGQKPIEAGWQFTGKKEKADIYNFTITIPTGQNTLSTTSKIIVYDGKEQVIYEDAQRKIYVRPEEK